MFSKDDYTIHQVVHFNNFGAKRPNVSRLNVCALVFSHSRSLSVQLVHFFFSSWTALWIANLVLRKAQCPGWRRLTERAKVYSGDSEG